MKFRVWFPEIGKFVKGTTAITNEGDLIVLEGEDWYCIDKQKSTLTVQQFTGLKDKNGRDVYEEDVVKGYFSVFNKVTNLFENQPIQLHHIWLYEASGRRAAEWVVSQNHFGSESAYTMQDIFWEEFEVVGNRYETPDIFKDEKNRI